MGKPKLLIPLERIEHYDRLVSLFPEVERKGATMPYTSLNGNMFSFMSPNGELALRLPEDALAQFLQRYKTGLFVQHGATMKEYALVPAHLLANTSELKAHFAASLAYARTLKPKATKKTGSKAKTKR